MTRPSTVEALEGWVRAARQVAGFIPATVVASKVDLPEVVPERALECLAVSVRVPLLFTSAKTGEGVREAFEDLARRPSPGRSEGGRVSPAIPGDDPSCLRPT